MQGKVFRIKGNYIKDLKSFDKVILLETENDMFYSSLSLINMSLFDKKSVLEDIEKAIIILPQ